MNKFLLRGLVFLITSFICVVHISATETEKYDVGVAGKALLGLEAGYALASWASNSDWGPSLNGYVSGVEGSLFFFGSITYLLVFDSSPATVLKVLPITLAGGVLMALSYRSFSGLYLEDKAHRQVETLLAYQLAAVPFSISLISFAF